MLSERASSVEASRFKNSPPAPIRPLKPGKDSRRVNSRRESVAFTINTNIASLQAQNYLRVNSDFQSKTINRVTSGLRIVTSGDDAAGLAIANGYRSDEAVLSQGVQNANNGLSQLQIMDGRISNISQ